jgi:hypothetical protein
MQRKIPLVLLVSLLLPFVLTSQEPTRGFPTDRTHGEGKLWLQWDESQRKGFVWGYIWGLDRGYHNGCDSLYAASPSLVTIDPSKGPDPLKNPLQECMLKLPVFSKPIAYYVTQITNFYGTYPQDQDLPLRQLFAQLADSSSNKTLEQIHSWYHTPS